MLIPMDQGFISCQGEKQKIFRIVVDENGRVVIKVSKYPTEDTSGSELWSGKYRFWVCT
jgi:hypothetical protein